MSLARVIEAVQKLAGLAPRNGLHGLIPPDQMRRVLDRERARAMRTGECLSLVTFALHRPADDRAARALLVKILRSRLRSR